MTSEASWLEQVLGVLNADHKDLLSEYRYCFLKSLESIQRNPDAKFRILMNKKDTTISKDFSSEIYDHGDDRDPPWMTTKIKKLICQRNELYSRIKKNNNSFLNKQLFDGLQLHLSKPIKNVKEITI